MVSNVVFSIIDQICHALNDGFSTKTSITKRNESLASLSLLLALSQIVGIFQCWACAAKAEDGSLWLLSLWMPRVEPALP